MSSLFTTLELEEKIRALEANIWVYYLSAQETELLDLMQVLSEKQEALVRDIRDIRRKDNDYEDDDEKNTTDTVGLDNKVPFQNHNNNNINNNNKII